MTHPSGSHGHTVLPSSRKPILPLLTVAAIALFMPLLTPAPTFAQAGNRNISRALPLESETGRLLLEELSPDWRETHREHVVRWQRRESLFRGREG